MSGQFGKFDFSLSNRFANTLGNSHHGGGFSTGGSTGTPVAPIIPPSSIGTGLKAWFRADSGVTLNTTNVASYADKSGAGITPTFGQDNPTMQPAFLATGINSLADIVYDGVDDFLSGSNSLYGTTTGVSLFGIIQTTYIGTQFVWGMQYNAYHYALFINVNGSQVGQLSFFPADGPNVVVSPARYDDGLPHCFIGTYDGVTGATALYVDNGSTPVATLAGSPLTITNGVADKNAMGSSVGAAANDRPYKGHLPEVGAYDNALAAPDIVSLMRYLKSRAGI